VRLHRNFLAFLLLLVLVFKVREWMTIQIVGSYIFRLVLFHTLRPRQRQLLALPLQYRLP
jgi:hypothetical protein